MSLPINSKVSTVALAVAAALGTGSAFALNQAATNAAPTQLVAAGSSAARDAFLSIFASEVCVAGTVDVYKSSTGDFRAYSCHLKDSVAQPDLGTVANTDAVIFYRAEGGSAWGPVSIATNTAVKALDTTSTFGTPAAANYVIGTTTLSLNTYTCTASAAYAISSDTGGTGCLVDKATGLGVADVEPKMFNTPNYPGGGATTTKFPAMSPAILSSLQGLTAAKGFGQVFGILLNNSGAATGGITNLSKSDVTALLSGAYSDWSQTVNNGGTAFNVAGAVTVARREPGSGTQVITSSYFLNTGCADGYNFVAVPANQMFPTGGGIESFVNTTANSMGISIYKNPAPTGTHFVSINGVAPSAQNAALGTYDFAAELTLAKASGLAGNALTFADALVKFASKHALVPPTVPANFVIPGGVAANPKSLPFTANEAPTAMSSRTGNTCKPFQGQ
jgi:hypothetical protein